MNYHGGATLPNAITPARSGLGTPLSSADIEAKEEEEQREARAAEENAARKGPPIPFRADTTGLSTSNLPKPPVRRLENELSLEAPSNTIAKLNQKPALPPRLPPRQSSGPSYKSTSPPPPYTVSPHVAASNSTTNEDHLRRLGPTRIKVPSFGISDDTSDSTPWQDQGNHRANPVNPPTQSSQLNELQPAFSKLSSKSPTAETPSQGTSFAQKQAALKTASSFRNDPSSISLSDAKATASTANNFRERHGDQVAAGWRKGNALNKKYGVMDKINSQGSNDATSTLSQAETTLPPSDNHPESLPSFKRKPPPPPLPKKIASESHSMNSPPPIPLASKPK